MYISVYMYVSISMRLYVHSEFIFSIYVVFLKSFSYVSGRGLFLRVHNKENKDFMHRSYRLSKTKITNQIMQVFKCVYVCIDMYKYT